MFTIQYENKHTFVNIKGVMEVDSMNSIEIERQLRLPATTKVEANGGDILISYRDMDVERNIRIKVESGMRDRIIFG